MRRILIPALAIACITILEFYALSQGINGQVLTTALAVIAGVGGYTLKVKQDGK